MLEYQKNNRFFAQVTGKMESLCEQELRELGAEKNKVAYRGIYFTADKAALYRINYMSRLVTRVLAPLLTFSCDSAHYLTKTAASVKWDEIFSLDKTFAITATVSNSSITHSLYASQCLKDGIVDYFTAKYGKRPNVNRKNPDIRFNLHIERNKAVISLDTSGESLHKRGYRQSSVEAPMQETLAAALVRLSGWNGESPLWDCMCGSGTILCEALMHYCRIPAQYLRRDFGFYLLPDFDRNVWERVREECNKNIRTMPRDLLRGSDKSRKAIEVTMENMRRLPSHEAVELSCMPFQKVSSYEQGIIVSNPPYGIRQGDKEEVKVLYKELGDFLKKKCCGTSAYLYIGDTSLRKYIGLKPSQKIPLVNGALMGELLRIDSYRITFRKPLEKKEIKKKREGVSSHNQFLL